MEIEKNTQIYLESVTYCSNSYVRSAEKIGAPIPTSNLAQAKIKKDILRLIPVNRDKAM